VGLGAPVGTGKPPGGDPEPIGKGGNMPVASGLGMLMGDAAARAERPARRMAVAYMLVIVGLLFEAEGVFIGDMFDVKGRASW
jgi:hypothetical protein